MRLRATASLFIASTLFFSSCASTPEPTGYLSDYSRLEEVDKRQMRYISPELGNYGTFIVDPVKILYEDENRKFTDEERAEIANYMRNALIRVLRENNYEVTTIPGASVALMRTAITDIQKAKALLNIHPGSKLTGAGTGRASMEMEILDSRDRRQLAASVKTGKGNQFEIDTFDKLDDVYDVIDDWAEEAAVDLQSLRTAQISE